MQEDEIDLLELFHVLRKNWKLLLITTIIAGILGGMVNFLLLPPEYRARTNLYVMNSASGSITDGQATITNSDLSSSLMLSKDYIQILKTNRVMDAAKQRMGVLTLDDYDISVSSASDTRMISIVVEGTDQKGVAKLANILTEEFVDTVQETMHMDNITVIDRATVPANPSGPARTKNTILVAMVGFVLAAAYSILRFLLDTTIKTEDDVEKHLGLPVLAQIPDFDQK